VFPVLFSMSTPPPPPHDPQIERILLQTVPWEARKKGGSILQDCLRDLGEKAVNIGFNYGEKNLACAREEGFIEGKEAGVKEGLESRSETAEASEVAMLHEKALEAERVWGYDIGWKLCSEQLQLRAPQASLVPPSHPFPRSLSAAATQTDTVDVTPVAATPAPAPLDWAEDAATLPICPSHSATPLSTPRDFSVLCTGSPQPFASLQRRRRRSPRSATSSLQNHSPRHSICRPQQKSGIDFRATQRTPPSYSYPPQSISIPVPTSFPPSVRPAVQFPLDWDQDPRLRDLGQVLAALGWVRL
jgi:hypothetical protein